MSTFRGLLDEMGQKLGEYEQNVIPAGMSARAAAQYHLHAAEQLAAAVGEVVMYLQADARDSLHEEIDRDDT